MNDLVQITPNVSKSRDPLKKGVYIRTFGCLMNEYDTAKLHQILEAEYQSVSAPEHADLVIINTCSVRDKPEQKLYSLLGELQELKSENPHLLVGVGGCVAQQEGAAIVKRSKTVDFVFGTHNLSLVPSLIESRQKGKAPQVAVDYRDEWEELPDGLGGDGRVCALISISRGCNKGCTYCIVPTTRGREVSRDPKEIEREVRIAAHRGAKEIMLLGQTVNSYGLDLSPRLRFADLLNRLAQIGGIQRIRFISPHPQEVRDDFIELVAENPKVCRHIHLPLQSGNDRILKLMNRNYRRSRYLAIIDALKSRVPDIAITTDIIVGFPGETEAEFEDSLDVMRQVQFDNSYSYMFSPRPGTIAAEMEDTVAAQDKLRRLQALQKLQEEISASRLAQWIGKRVEVLIDEPRGRDTNRVQGRISQNTQVQLMNPGAALKPGMTVQADIESAARFSLRGTVACIAHGS